MKLAAPVGLFLLWSTVSWAQTPETEIERLSRTVQEQGVEIEELKAQIARIETAMGLRQRAVLQPASLASAPIAPRRPAQEQPAVAGFRFSGDFRLRLDASFRGASTTTPGLQNVRGRYRARLNTERTIAPDLSFRLQLATGSVNNGVSLDQDFAAGATRAPFFISEAWVDYHPTPDFSIRGGRVEEVYADNTGFFWDDDVRFNGINERYRKGRFEFRAGQYFLVNPNSHSVSATSPLTLAGVEPGTIARASQMFHQGVSVNGDINPNLRHQFTADVQLYRNPNLIALTTNPAGVNATLSSGIGLTLSGPGPGVGNATRTPAGAILYAAHYQIVRASYRLDSSGLGGNARLPFTWVVQASRNVGTSQLRDAMLTSVSIGRTTNPGDIRGLYGFTIKDANAFISQFTDDNIGTGSGVNLATHYLRGDVTIRPNIQFQNLLFIQNARRSSNPAASFFVPIGREAPRSWRFQGQLAFSF